MTSSTTTSSVFCYPRPSIWLEMEMELCPTCNEALMAISRLSPSARRRRPYFTLEKQKKLISIQNCGQQNPPINALAILLHEYKVTSD